MSGEPILRADDREAWSYWERVASVHASTRAFTRRVDGAKRLVERALVRGGRACVMWSAGKDSTCLAHLVVQEMGLRHVELVSEKDDLDYPGEEAYVERLAAEWGAKLRILRPDVSALGWVREHMVGHADEIHSRSAGLSKAVFYRLVDQANREYAVVMMGLRAAERGPRKRVLESMGPVYEVQSGARVHASPLAWWSGLDVLAYALTRGFELLPVYRCIALLHREAPWEVRKSWWLGGEGSRRHGHLAWLRHYWPSLYAEWVSWMPAVRVLT